MAQTLIARGQATITIQKDGYTITQSLGEYIFPADQSGKILSAVSVTSTISVTLGDSAFTNFTIGTITKPTGFSSISVNNTNKTVTFAVAANTTTLADHGNVEIPIVISGTTYKLTFVWSKAKKGDTGAAGVDANLLDWVKEWNTGKTLINSNTVITPKLFAGAKNTDGTISGVALGSFALSTKASSGTITTETVNGIYGFKDGYKTFYVDNGGNAQLGYGNEYIKYNASTGKIEFGSAVSMQWVGATYIDKDGIFTGTLSADAVNAINIAASQITSGKISATYINTDELKSTLITASNINALTLTTTKGTIGGWSIDSDSIYRGTKKNTATTYTAASGSMTIGSTGIRGYKWRLESTGAGAVAGGNISWDASGNVTFANAVSLNWTEPIDGITEALGGDEFPKLTKITAEGIYTGSITASQITAGTISADRIAAGSITAAKLDAASIKSDIINTTYINGLECTFTKGKIGNWTITSNKIYNSQISLDAGNKRIVVYASTATATSGHRVQLYYNSNSDFGFWATDSAGTCIISLGSTNKIAGWAITSTSISKGNVSLGSDGSITNGTKWKLNNDGSGQIASGNISWDASGNVTFASSVSVAWTEDIDAITTALGGDEYPKLTKLSATGVYTGTLTATQVNAVSINASSIKAGTLSADRIAAGSITAAKLDAASIKSDIINTNYINGLECTFTKGTIGGWAIASNKISHSQIALDATNKRIAVFSTTGSATSGQRVQLYYNNNNDFGFLAVSSTGATLVSLGSYNVIAGWAITPTTISKGNVSMGSDGSVTNGTKWKLNNDGSGRIASGNISWDASGNVTFANAVSLNWTEGIDAITVALGGENFTKLTKISSTGVYTGTVKANQVLIDSALVVGGSSYNGSISVRDADNSIKVTLDRTGITATAGKIGGWVLSSGSLTASTPNSGHRIVMTSSGYIYHDNPNTAVDYWGLKSDGSATFGTGKISFDVGGSGFVAGGNFSWDVDGNITAQKGTFKDVEVIGTVRNPFILNDSSIYIGMEDPQMNFNKYDHVVAIRGSWDEDIPLPWTLEHSGRRVCLVNYKWGSNTTVGTMSITAPSGKYFYEDGISKSTITFSRELVELLGYGDNTTFFGWIVVNRLDLMTSKKYGKNMKFLAQGTVTVSSTSSYSVKYQTFDGNTITVSRLGKGQYRVYLPSSWNMSGYFQVFLSGIYSAVDSTPIYATLKALYSYYFDVYTADDNSTNDGSFSFLVVSTGDWK